MLYQISVIDEKNKFMLNSTKIKLFFVENLRVLKMGQAKSTQKEISKHGSIKENPNYSKWLTQGLIFSVALNLALITSIVFNAVKGKEGHSKAKNKTQLMTQVDETSSLKQTLVNYSEKSFQDLVSLLSQDKHIEDGFTERDLALSILCHQHDVDIDRALMGQATMLRFVPLQGAAKSTYEYPVFAGVTNAQYKLIQTFIQNEKWPQTSHGLFNRLLKNINDESLKSAFYLSKEFMYIDGLFCSLSISKEVLLNIILQGNWETLENFISEHHQIQDFSNALRIQFLKAYLNFGSQYAARLILEIDAGYALKKLDDSQIVALLSLLEDKTNLAENFAVHLAFGNRSDWVRQEACRLLYHYFGLTLPNPYSYSEAVQLISQKYQIDSVQTLTAATSSASTEEEITSPSTSRRKTYLVQDGDTLWKIARRNNVSLDDLREANHLNSDLIKVGMPLVIP